MKKAASVQQIRVKENVSYDEAEKRAGKEKQSDRQEWGKEQVSYAEAEKRAGKEKQSDRQEWGKEQVVASVALEVEKKVREEKK